MIYRHFSALPEKYNVEHRDDGLVNVWLCKQVDSYLTPDGVREFDIDVRAVHGVEDVDGLEADIRARWGAWWDAAVKWEG